MHPQRDLRLLAVAAERALADQQADDHAAVEVGHAQLICPNVLARSSGCFTVKKNVKRIGRRRATRGGARERLRQSTSGATTSRRGLLALAVRLDVVARLQVLVHDLALERAHRLERDGTVVVNRGLGGLIGGGAQCDGPALAIAGGIDHDAFARVQPRNAIR